CYLSREWASADGGPSAPRRGDRLRRPAAPGGRLLPLGTRGRLSPPLPTCDRGRLGDAGRASRREGEGSLRCRGHPCRGVERRHGGRYVQARVSGPNPSPATRGGLRPGGRAPWESPDARSAVGCTRPPGRACGGGAAGEGMAGAAWTGLRARLGHRRPAGHSAPPQNGLRCQGPRRAARLLGRAALCDLSRALGRSSGQCSRLVSSRRTVYSHAAGIGRAPAKADRLAAPRKTSTAEEPVMFANSKAFSGFAVDDLSKARGFYAETLGLKTSEEHGLMTLHLAGDRNTLVYPKPDHAPADYTILNFPVEDIDAAVAELTARGVRFERYSGLEQDEKGVFRGGGPYIA